MNQQIMLFQSIKSIFHKITRFFKKIYCPRTILYCNKKFLETHE